MPVIRTYRCSACGFVFEHLHMNDDDNPEGCPHCQLDGEHDDEPLYIQLPSQAKLGGSYLSRSVDQTYRQVEESSQVRAQMAADSMEAQYRATGMDGAEAQRQAEAAARAVKVTDLKDNLRVGDVAAKPPPQPSAEYNAMLGQLGGSLWQGSVSDAIAMTKQGPDRGTGSGIVQHIQNDPMSPHKRMRGSLIRP